MLTQRMQLSVSRLFISLVVLLLLAAVAGIYFGAVNLQFYNMNAQHQLIFFELRLPRVLLSLVIGANLAFCGALSQGLFRNALADPSLIGVTAGASLGAGLIIVGALTFSSFFTALPVQISLVAVGAFFGGLLTVMLVYQLAARLNSGSVLTMLLVGIAVTAFASAVTGLLDFYADSEQLRRLSLWRMGGLQAADYSAVQLATLVLLVLFTCGWRYASALDAVLLGESEARFLGINVDKVKLHLIVLIALGTGTAVALAGTIAFVGLIVPHILRVLVGPGHRFLLPASALGGGILLSLADTCARTVVAPTELPVGLLTALLGAPFFVLLLRQQHVR